MLAAPADVHERVVALYRAVPGRAAEHVFDTALAATALSYGTGRVYTYNTNDFDGLPGITVLTP